MYVGRAQANNLKPDEVFCAQPHQFDEVCSEKNVSSA